MLLLLRAAFGAEFCAAGDLLSAFGAKFGFTGRGCRGRLLLRRAALAQIDGFDERYHMYCEDVDLCLSLQEADWRLVRADAAVVEHAAQRDSRRRLRPLLWHVRSLLRLWGSPAWRAWRARPAPRAAAHGSAPHR